MASGDDVTSFDARLVRQDIPLLHRSVNGHPITYLDSGATSLTPRPVIEAMSRYYEQHHANVHRAVYVTAEEATATYEGARLAVGDLFNARNASEEVVFTKNATESFNLLAKSWGRANLQAGDAVVLTQMEHHANIVPWFQLRDEIDIDVRFLRVDDEYRLDLSNLDELLKGAKLLSVTGMSNVLGTINPLRALADAAHHNGALVAVDAAQSIAHGPFDVQALDVDFIAFSAHKMLGPTGIGIFWTREEILQAMPPFLGGGGMIADVRLDGYTPASGPTRFEAGTPPIAEAAGLNASVLYLQALGMDNIAKHEAELTADALARLDAEFGDVVRVIGPSSTIDRGGVISFVVQGVHPHDVAQVLDQFGVCVRPGHHCAKPLMKRFDLAATVRASFGPYSLAEDTNVLLEALAHSVKVFA